MLACLKACTCLFALGLSSAWAPPLIITSTNPIDIPALGLEWNARFRNWSCPSLLKLARVLMPSRQGCAGRLNRSPSHWSVDPTGVQPFTASTIRGPSRQRAISGQYVTAMTNTLITAAIMRDKAR